MTRDDWTCYFCGRTRYVRKADRAACHRCGVNICARHSWFSIDGNNGAITRSAPPHCPTCAEFLEPRLIA